MEISSDRTLPLLADELRVTVEGDEFRIRFEGRGVTSVNGASHTFDFTEVSQHRYSLLLDNKSYSIFADANGVDNEITVNGNRYLAIVDDNRSLLRKSLLQNRPHVHQSQTIIAPMPGLVVRVEVQVGEEVKVGQGLIVLEAMKMENEINALQSGKVDAIYVKAGKTVEKGETLISIVRD